MSKEYYQPIIDPDKLTRLLAEKLAHRAVGNQEQDACNGKLAGHCIVCQTPWPCEYAKPEVFIPDSPMQQECWNCGCRYDYILTLCPNCNKVSMFHRVEKPATP
jgi:hypothetical protein